MHETNFFSHYLTGRWCLVFFYLSAEAALFPYVEKRVVGSVIRTKTKTSFRSGTWHKQTKLLESEAKPLNLDYPSNAEKHGGTIPYGVTCYYE